MLSISEATALAAIRQEFQRPVIFVNSIGSALLTNAIYTETNEGQPASFEFDADDLPSKPTRGDFIDRDGEQWVVIDVVVRRDINAWEAHVVTSDRFSGVAVIERGVVADDGYTSDGPTEWAEYFRGVAKLSFGSGTERREAARVMPIVTATFDFAWGEISKTITAKDRLRYPVQGVDYSDSSIWNIVSAVPTDLNNEFAVTAVQQSV